MRFEDLSLTPELTVVRLLAFLGLARTERLDQFIRTHTATDAVEAGAGRRRTDPYATSRNSSAVAFAWRKEMPVSRILEVQATCREPMKLLGYREVRGNETENNKELPLDKTASEVWPSNHSNREEVR